MAQRCIQTECHKESHLTSTCPGASVSAFDKQTYDTHGVRTNNICSISVVLKKRFSRVMIHCDRESFTKGNKEAQFPFITDCVSLSVLGTQTKKENLL